MQFVSVDSLEIENFGPYYGRHIFNFQSLDGRSAVLVGGKNGVGKTHLLRALYLATAGESGKIDLKKLESSADATKFNFEESLNRRAAREGADVARLIVTLSQTDATGSGTRKLTLDREIRYRAATTGFKSIARLSGEGGETDDDKKIEKLRDAFLPRHLARFFFFDAERSQSVQLTEREITEGVSRILGLWTYGELEEDLRNLINHKIPRSFGSGSEAERKLADLNADVQRCEGNLRALQNEKEEISIQLIDTESQLNEIEDELRTIGATDPQQLAELRAKRDDLTKREAQIESALTQAWDFGLPVALLGGYRRQLSEYLTSEEARRDWESRRDSVEPRIPQVQSQVFDGPPGEHELSAPTREFYRGRLTSALRKLFDPPPAGMSDRIFVAERTELSAQIRGRLGGSLSEVQTLAASFAELEQKRAELRDLNQQINQLQQNREALERGNELREKRARCVAEQEAMQRRLRSIETEITQLENQIGEKRREETVVRQEAEKIAKGRTVAALAHRYREAVADIRQQAAVQLREQIAAVVGELWVEITERGLEWTGMEFDPRWNCQLIRRNGQRVDWERANPSAGQRQVRVLAFTEALRRLARLAPPLIVDTPMGRLDKEVRRAVLETLYLSGHQSIILSTNSEIDPESDQFDRITSKLARVYTLHPQGNPESEEYEVRVTEDYFGKSL
jgi:DNA sulfur modification protein DndD